VKRTRFLKTAVVVIALLVAMILVAGDLRITPAGLDPGRPRAAQHALALFVLCMALWLTNCIPLAATGLLAVALLPMLGVLPQNEAFALFGNSAVFFMLGVFMLAAAMISTGLSKRLTLVFLQRFDHAPKQLLFGMLITPAFLAFWMPEHAVAAMIFPILVEIVESLGLKKGSSDYAKSLFLALAWGCIIGGVATMLGGARAPLALGLLDDFSGQQISFLKWMAAGLPIVLVMLAVAWWVLTSTFTCDVESIRPATKMLDESVKRLGPMSKPERRLAILGCVTVACWIFVGHTVGLAVIALSSATMLFVFRIADWHQIQDYVNWGVLIMYGGAVALGSALSSTHAFGFLVERLLSNETPRFVVLGIMATVTIILTEGISNSAAVAILLPIGYSLCGAVGVDPVTMTLAVAIPAGLAFSLPISSPPNAICFSAGYYGVGDVARRGVVMSMISLLVFLLAMGVYWPILHLGGG